MTTWRDVMGNVSVQEAWASFVAMARDGETLALWMERQSAELWQATGEHRAENWNQLAGDLLGEVAVTHAALAPWPEPTAPRPSLEDIETWSDDGGCEATDSCWVEPDGICEHGHPSWLLRLGLV